MFEPACRGGSKRSLNISNPTPKWPRSPGEMVSAPARAADTQTHALTRTLGPTHTRWAPCPPSLSLSALGASDFISCFLDFNLPGWASPGPGRASPAQPSPAGAFRSSVSSTGRNRGDRPALPSAQRVRGTAATTRPLREVIARAEAVRGCPREIPRALRGFRVPGLGLCRLGLTAQPCRQC